MCRVSIAVVSLAAILSMFIIGETAGQTGSETCAVGCNDEWTAMYFHFGGGYCKVYDGLGFCRDEAKVAVDKGGHCDNETVDTLHVWDCSKQTCQATCNAASCGTDPQDCHQTGTANEGCERNGTLPRHECTGMP